MINKKTKSMKKLTKKIINSETTKILYLTVFFTVSFINLSYAGTGGSELTGAYDKIMGLLQGTGGKIMMAVSGTWAIMGSLMKFNPSAVFSTAGIGIAIPVVSGFIDASVTALI